MNREAYYQEHLWDCGIPEYMHSAILNYLLHRLQPGDFLLGVLSNDLAKAVGHADANNRGFLPNYVTFLYNYVPSECWGNEVKVLQWLSPKQEDPAEVQNGVGEEAE